MLMAHAHAHGAASRHATCLLADSQFEPGVVAWPVLSKLRLERPRLARDGLALSKHHVQIWCTPTCRSLLQATAQYFSLSDLDLACARWFFLVRQFVLPLIRPCRCDGDSGAGSCSCAAWCPCSRAARLRGARARASAGHASSRVGCQGCRPALPCNPPLPAARPVQRVPRRHAGRLHCVGHPGHHQRTRCAGLLTV